VTKTRPYIPTSSRYSLRWWLERIRSLAFIAAVTVLIWVYADMDVAEDRTFRAAVELTTASSSQVELLTPLTAEVKFTLRGTRKSLRTFQEQLDQDGGRIEYDVGGDYPPGSNSVSVEDLVNESEILSRLNLSMLSSAPSSINFTLDKRVTTEAVVQFDYTGANLTQDPIVEPARVKLRLAQMDLDALRKDLGEDQPIVLKTRQVNLAPAPAGRPETQQVEVRPPPAKFLVELDPTRVAVTYQINQRTATQRVAVNVQAICPASWAGETGIWSEYMLVRLDPLEWKPEIEVTGPRQDLEKLKPEMVEAYVTLTELDTRPTTSWLTGTVRYAFPAGMNIQVLGEKPVVHYRLDKRPEGALVVPAAPATTPPLPTPTPTTTTAP
jgi:hypothetical protein